MPKANHDSIIDRRKFLGNATLTVAAPMVGAAPIAAAASPRMLKATLNDITPALLAADREVSVVAANDQDLLFTVKVPRSALRADPYAWMTRDGADLVAWIADRNRPADI